MYKEFKLFTIALFGFALLATWAPKAQAADTSDVIAGIILGGIIGSQIQKSQKGNVSSYNFPGGTLIIPTPKVNGKTCWIKLDVNGYPESVSPHCYGYSPTSGRWNQSYETPDEAFRRNYPCGGQWGAGCRKLIEKLK